MMGRREDGQGQFFYSFDLDKVGPPDHLVRQISESLLQQSFPRRLWLVVDFLQSAVFASNCPEHLSQTETGCRWMTVRLLATAHTVKKEIYCLSDPPFDLMRGGTDAKGSEPKAVVNDKADELLRGALEIIHAQL